jgi:hypothetical protein
MWVWYEFVAKLKILLGASRRHFAEKFSKIHIEVGPELRFYKTFSK